MTYAYLADGDKVYVEQNGRAKELFLTVHPTDRATVTIEQQAKIIANLLNQEFT